MSVSVLRACPFCGSKPRHGKGMRRKTDTLYQKAGDWMWKPFAGCKPCGFSRSFESAEDAEAWWNGNGTKKRSGVACAM